MMVTEMWLIVLTHALWHVGAADRVGKDYANGECILCLELVTGVDICFIPGVGWHTNRASAPRDV